MIGFHRVQRFVKYNVLGEKLFFGGKLFLGKNSNVMEEMWKIIFGKKINVVKGTKMWENSLLS